MLVDEDDVEEGFVRVHPYLDQLIWWLIGDDVDILDADGAVLGVHDTEGLMLDGRDTDVLFGPETWLDSLRPVMAAAVTDGQVRWTALDEPPAATARQIAAMQNGFDRALGEDEAIAAALWGAEPPDSANTSADSAVREALLVDREAFVADEIPPLPDLYAAAGLEFRDHSLARAGFDWSAHEEWRQTNQIVATYDMEREDVSALRSMSDTVRAVSGRRARRARHDRRRSARRRRGVRERCSIGRWWPRRCGIAIPRATTIRPISTVSPLLLREHVGPIDSDGLDWIAARGLDHGAGDVDAAVALLDAAIERGSTNELILIDAAGHALGPR